LTLPSSYFKEFQAKLFLALTTVKKDKNLQKKGLLVTFLTPFTTLKKLVKTWQVQELLKKKVPRNVAVYVGKNARLKNVACFRNE
jgi:hypothetical protein